MTDTTPVFGLTVPNADGSDAADLAALLRALGLDIENKAPGITVLTAEQRLALTGPGLYGGRVVFDTTDATLYMYAAGAWIPLARLAADKTLPMAGKKITGMADGTAATDAASKGQLDAAMPVGVVTSYAGAAAPAGWALCDGAAVSRTTYPGLFAAIGTSHGAGNGSTTFNLPDLRGRFVLAAGAGSGLTVRALAAKSGTENHTLTAGEMPTHSHGGATGSNGSHSHSYSGSTSGVGDHTHAAWGEAGSGYMIDTWQYSDGNGTPGGSTLPAGAHSHTYSGGTSTAAAHSHTIPPDGSGEAHNNMPPFYTLTYIIKLA